MERNELSECMAIAKARFKNLFDIEVAREWASMDYTIVKDYLSYSIPETIILHGMSGEYIKQRHEEDLNEERQRNFSHYGLFYSDDELLEHKEEFLEAQRQVNFNMFGHRWTDDELILEHWTEVWNVEDPKD